MNNRTRKQRELEAEEAYWQQCSQNLYEDSIVAGEIDPDPEFSLPDHTPIDREIQRTAEWEASLHRRYRLPYLETTTAPDPEEPDGLASCAQQLVFIFYKI